MTTFSPLVSSPSPISACCEETLRHFESDSSPTPAVFFRECRPKSCATKRPSDDDSALPPHHTRATHTVDQNRSQGQMSTMDQECGVNAREQDDNEHIIQQVPIDTFGPSYDAPLIFVSTRSLGIAPSSTPSPKLRSSLLNTTQENRPLHLAAASSALTMPSSAEYMDISPEFTVRIADSYAERNQPRAYLIDDPFKGSFDNACPNSRNVSPIIGDSGTRDINMELLSETRKQSTVAIESPHAFFGRSKCPATNGEMDIDSPGYHMRTIPRHYKGIDPQQCASPDVDCSNAVQPPTRSASQGSIGKRSRIDEGGNQRFSSTSGFRRPSSGHRSSYPSMLRFIKPRQSNEHLNNSTVPFEDSNPFSPEPLSTSPTDEASPCVNVFSRKAVYQASAASPISAFRFPVSRSNLRGENHTHTCNTVNSKLDSCAQLSTSKVAQSSAALFNRHQISVSENLDVKSLEDRTILISSTRLISPSQNSLANLESSPYGSYEEVEQTEEHEDMDVSMALSSSSPSRSFTTSERSLFSDVSSKFKSSKTISTCSNESKASRCAAPLSLKYLQPPHMNSMSALQSPSGSFTFTLGSTIKSPVGMAFSEKERAGKILPCHKVSSDGLMRISPQTMDKVFEGFYDESISSKMIIDCRFGYEYEGGHIQGAINLQDKETLETMLLHGELFAGGKKDVPIPSESGKPDENGETKKVVLIFHCEYSAMRAPAVAKYLREQDRHMNMNHYPALHYPEIYILEGGYARYHSHSPQYCSGSYIQMDDPSYKSDRHTDLNLFRTRENLTFSRAKSFTYGDSKPTKHSKNIKSSAGLTRFGIGKKLDLLSEQGKENTPTRSRIIEEEDGSENDDSLQASSPLYRAISGSVHSKKPSLKVQGRSISMLAQVEQNQPRGINGKTNIFN